MLSSELNREEPSRIVVPTTREQELGEIFAEIVGRMGALAILAGSEAVDTLCPEARIIRSDKDLTILADKHLSQRAVFCLMKEIQSFLREILNIPFGTEEIVNTFGECWRLSPSRSSSHPLELYFEKKRFGVFNSGIIPDILGDFSLIKTGRILSADRDLLVLYYGQVLIAELLRYIHTQKIGKIHARIDKLGILGIKSPEDVHILIRELCKFLLTMKFSKQNSFLFSSLRELEEKLHRVVGDLFREREERQYLLERNEHSV